jgi:hypothetical protein
MKYNALKIVQLSCLFACMSSLHTINAAADSVSRLDEAWGKLKSLGSTIVTGVQSMVGYLPDSYYYNYRVWNDSPAQVLIGVQGMINLQSAKSEGDYHTFVELPWYKDFHDYILCPPAFNTGTAGYKTALTMQIYMSLFDDQTRGVYYASFQAFDAYNKKRITQNAQFGLSADKLITKSVVELPWQKAKKESAGGNVRFERMLKPEYANNALAKKLLSDTVEDTFKKNNIVPEVTYEHSDADVENDESVYFYRVYRDKTGVKSEYLQWGGTVKVPGQTTEFLGTFYVSSKQKDLFLTFYKDGASYTVALEPGSFNLLQSTPGVTESIRPSLANQFTEKFGFQIYQGNPASGGSKNTYIPISSYGPAYVGDARTKAEYSATPPAPMKPIVGGPRPYTYELFDVQVQGALGVACHSMREGEYPMPATPNKQEVRDINPIQCHIWLQSVEESMVQKTKDYEQNLLDAQKLGKKIPSLYSEIPVNSSDQMWIAYQTADSSVIQKLTSRITTFKVLRPRLSEKLARMYICSVATTDDKKAQQFMQRLASQVITLPASHQEVTEITPATVAQAIAKMQPNTYGIITDTTGNGATGLSAHLLATDIFLPNGLGSSDRYYYIYPPSLLVGNLAGMLPLEKPISGDDFGAFSRQVATWITSYISTGKDAAIQAVTSYLQQFGAKELFVDQTATGNQRVLTAQGKKFVESFVTGAISIAHPPLVWKAGLSYPIVQNTPPKGFAEPTVTITK